jgi:hypothetical protein
MRRGATVIGISQGYVVGLASQGSDTQIWRAHDQVRANQRRFTGQRQTFLAMQDEVKDLRRNHPHSGMSNEQWAALLLDYKGEVDDNLAA